MTPYYERDDITIYHGDCREILPELEPVDLVLTDPPYGKKYARGKHGIGAGQKWNAQHLKWDGKPDFVKEAAAAGKFAIVWGCEYFCGQLGDTKSFLVWDKQNGKNVFADCEIAWTNLTTVTKIYVKQWIGAHIAEDLFHPTQKPVAVMSWCITLSPDCKTILDPFMGSGTTLVAAKMEGRKAIGIEIEEKYCEIAVNRLRQGVLSL